MQCNIVKNVLQELHVAFEKRSTTDFKNIRLSIWIDHQKGKLKLSILIYVPCNNTFEVINILLQNETMLAMTRRGLLSTYEVPSFVDVS